MQFDDSKLYALQCKEKQTPSLIPAITGNQHAQGESLPGNMEPRLNHL